MDGYHYQVIQQGVGVYQVKYEGDDVALAMAAWSAIISNDGEYATLEALRKTKVSHE